MSNEAAVSPLQELTTSPYTVETEHAIMSTIEQLISAGNEHLALVTIRLFYGIEAIYSPLGCMLAEKNAQSFLYDLRPLVRKTDKVLLSNHTLYFLLPGATLHGGQIVQSRLWEAVVWRIHTHLTESDSMCPQSITIGHSSYKLSEKMIPECVAEANVAQFRFDAQPEKASCMHAIETQDKQSKIAGDEELQTLARTLGIPYLQLLPSKVPKSLQHLVTPELAHELCCYPLGRERNMLTVAMLNPADRTALDRLKQETGLQIFPILTHPKALQIALEHLAQP